jgi:hypothetical protein
VNDLSFFDYDVVCFSLTLLGLLLTVLEFRKTSRSDAIIETTKLQHVNTLASFRREASPS